MIIKGSSRGQSSQDAKRLADHLLDAKENETITVVEIVGTTVTDLHGALAEMRAVSLGSRARRCLYHASLNVGRDETAAMSPERWREAVDELERALGMVGHARAVVGHRKRGRDHVHVVWSRIDPLTLKCASDANSYHIHEAVSRALETKWCLRPVIGAHTRPADVPRPVAKATHADWQAAERTKIPVEDVASRIQGAWRESRDGREFATALEKRGLCLARGRRGILIADEAGMPHSISRRLGLRVAEVRKKLADLDAAAVPDIEDVCRTRKGRKPMERKTLLGIASTPPPADVDWEALEAYWRALGFDPVKRFDALFVDAYGTQYRDYGSRVEIVGDGEPTDEQITALVAAGKTRGWKSVYFYGCSESFQKRARLEAIKQGYPPEAISLECERHSKGGRPSREPMPDHLRKRLGVPDPSPAPANTDQPECETRRTADGRPAQAP